VLLEDLKVQKDLCNKFGLNSMDVAKNNVVRDKLKLQFTDLMVSVFILMLFIISNICA